MDGASFQNALDRIEAAIARLESAAARPPQKDEALAARHERLRSAVSQSLRRLDDLIASQPE
jgi:hypothetical protein